MKICINCKINKQITEFNKNKRFKDGLQYWCRSCTQKYALSVKSSKEGKEKELFYAKTYRDRPEIKTKKSNYKKKYGKTIKGKAKNNAYIAKRHAAKLQATPPWLTKEQFKEIETFYIEAAKRTRETGIDHEVDHIIPLQGKEVRGLPVPWNLQILTKAENCSKGNRIVM